MNSRNMTSHLYKESMAEEVYAKLGTYLPLFKALTKKLA
ncbi:MAG TPA: nucleotidyltransferase substrate binding protein [Candidatus Sulfotelmatobacter sp.]|nr:nucleotidyltransferase substrate binding protein [Candidatus Sulfotelmatobacter sp.]